MKLIYERVGAIDIGSNAMRLLICGVYNKGENNNVKKVSLTRLPVRLGEEAFLKGEISEATQKRFFKAMESYRNILDVYGITNYRACATSALREAANGSEIVDKVKKQTGITIDIISGEREAEYIFGGHFRDKTITNQHYVYVDIGGGSTEVSILKGRDIRESASFQVGTLRLLNQSVPPSVLREMKKWVEEKTAKLKHVEMVGSGGNVNKIYKLAGVRYPKPMLYGDLKKMRNKLSKLSVEERMLKYRLNPDRADVIVPAANICHKVMKWSDCSILHVPKIGLSDGIIIDMLKNEIEN